MSGSNCFLRLAQRPALIASPRCPITFRWCFFVPGTFSVWEHQPKSRATTTIALIPKVKGADDLGKF